MTGGSISGSWSPGGFGAWIPFLPRTLAVKLAMIDVVETIQQVVTGAHDKPWPGQGFKVRAEHQGASVRLVRGPERRNKTRRRPSGRLIERQT